jgi:hypothetical protein
MAKVLDAKQQAKWKQMLGKPFTGTLAWRPPGGPRSNRTTTVALPPTLAMLQAPAVQEDLKLSDAQRKSLAERAKKYADEYPAREGLARQWRQRLQKYRDDAEADAVKLLSEKQSRRLEQIRLQQTGRQGLSVLLASAEVAEKLRLTDKQKAVLASLDAEERQIGSLISTELSRPAREERVDVARTRDALARVMDKKRNEALTGAQKKALEELLGPEFKGQIGRSRRGFGGFSS